MGQAGSDLGRCRVADRGVRGSCRETLGWSGWCSSKRSRCRVVLEQGESRVVFARARQIVAEEDFRRTGGVHGKELVADVCCRVMLEQLPRFSDRSQDCPSKRPKNADRDQPCPRSGRGFPRWCPSRQFVEHLVGSVLFLMVRPNKCRLTRLWVRSWGFRSIEH